MTRKLVPLVALVALVGCRQDMHDQPRYEPLEESQFFGDGRASRDPIDGTVARGQLAADTAFHTGMGDGAFVASSPLPRNREVLERGRDRYDIFCTPCHDRVGNGLGMIVRRGFQQPNSFHIERLREAGDGYYFDVMTNGFGQMSSYAAQIRAEDRWAIVAYIRALQLSQNAPAELLTEEDRAELAASVGRASEEPDASDAEDQGQETHG